MADYHKTAYEEALAHDTVQHGRENDAAELKGRLTHFIHVLCSRCVGKVNVHAYEDALKGGGQVAHKDDDTSAIKGECLSTCN